MPVVGEKMKIGIYAFWNIECDGDKIRGLGCHIRYLKHFLKYTEGVRLFTSISNGHREGNTESLSDPKLEIVRIPWSSFASAWLNLINLKRLLKENLAGLDAVYIRLYDPCPWLLVHLCEERDIGVVLHIVGNPIAGIFQRQDLSMVGKWLRRAMFFPEETLVQNVMGRHTVLVDGTELSNLFTRQRIKNKNILSSTLEEKDFYDREDTCLGVETKILYVGYLRPAKRLDILIQAISMLLQESRKVSLRIVGPIEVPGYMESLHNQISSLRIEEKVNFAGFVPLGDELNAEYRKADIFVLPSATEGNPRVLLEAAANALPIVTTDVGGVRDHFVDGKSALIVPINDPLALARAIALYLDNPDLRHRCIRNAREVAQKQSCESFIKQIIHHLEKTKEPSQPHD